NHGLAIEPGAAAETGLIHFVARGRIDDAGDGNAVFDHREAHRPAILATKEGAGAIDGINDKDAIAIEAARIVGGFFTQPAIGGARIEEARRQIAVDDDVRLAHWRGIFLVPALYIAPEIARSDDPRGHSSGAE